MLWPSLVGVKMVKYADDLRWTFFSYLSVLVSTLMSDGAETPDFRWYPTSSCQSSSTSRRTLVHVLVFSLTSPPELKQHCLNEPPRYDPAVPMFKPLVVCDPKF